MKKILFTGGGSAGHVIPNLALIEEILSEGDADVCYMGTGGIEKQLVAEWHIPYFQIECPKLVREKSLRAFKRNLRIPTEFFRARQKALEGLETFQPDLVFSKGGYVALPVISAARKLHIPCLAHESDFSVGLANRLSARKCKYVFTSFPETANRVPHGKYSGAPLRRSVLYASRAEARKKFSIPFDAKVILVFGGGSGSKALNNALRTNLKKLTQQYTILHVCGKGNLVQSTMKNYRQFEFISDMGMAYACADLIISRAGSGTVFEILALKKSSLLVPLEGQTRGDQQENAAYFAKKGLCRIVSQNELVQLPQAIETAFEDESMKERLAKTDFGKGNETILREIREILKT